MRNEGVLENGEEIKDEKFEEEKLRRRKKRTSKCQRRMGKMKGDSNCQNFEAPRTGKGKDGVY